MLGVWVVIRYAAQNHSRSDVRVWKYPMRSTSTARRSSRALPPQDRRGALRLGSVRPELKTVQKTVQGSKLDSPPC